jgi:hypothetical protein
MQNHDGLSGEGSSVVYPRSAHVAAFFLCVFFSFFWDETALLVYPAIILFFPRLVLNVRYGVIYLLLPVALYLSYMVIIPMLTTWSGTASGENFAYYIENMLLIVRPSFHNFLAHYYLNTKLLILESLGIVPVHPSSPWWNLVPIMVGQAVLLLILLSIRNIWRDKLAVRPFLLRLSLWIAGLFLLTLFHNALLTMSNGVWGLFWYGAYWAVFFVIFLAWLLQGLKINQYLLTIAMAIVLFNLGNIFLETNKIYKRMHYYPYMAQYLDRLFVDDQLRFDPGFKPQFSGQQLREFVIQYWRDDKKSLPQKADLPKELFFVDLELHPGRYKLPKTFFKLSPFDIYYPNTELSKYRTDKDK